MDIVSDTNQNCSIKEARGIGKTVNFNEDDYMPETFKMKDFFQSSVNKTKLIEIIRKHAVNPLCWQWSGEVTVSLGQRVSSRSYSVREIMAWQDALHDSCSR